MAQENVGLKTPKHPEVNGLGESWDPRRPTFRGVNLTKPDPRLKTPSVEISGDREDTLVAFVNVNILDSTGRDPYRGDVLVKGQRIISVGRKLSPDDLRGARVYQGNGRTLMSGLCDSHAHASFINSPTLDEITAMPIEEHTLLAARSARMFLDSGYTMCMGAAAAKPRLDLVVRNAIQAGDIPGPRYLANGQEMAPTDGALCEGITTFVNSVDEIVKTVHGFADSGVDAVKFSMSGDEILEDLRAEDSTFPDDMVAAGTEAAHSKGIRTCSHARSDESIRQCLQYGVDILYHGSFISDESMYALEAQKNRVYVAPALNILYASMLEAEQGRFGFPKSAVEKYKRELDVCIAGLKEMRKRGVKVLPGGDYGFAWTPHGSYRDLELFVNLVGFTPMEAILSATALGGEIMMHPNELGKVQPGYYADLLLVNGNPLEDITLLSDPKNLDVIVINGRVHKDNTV
ncbi:dipeptidase [Hygrophoropsis aurantiaca]|uniref:Dipeptidase n=1 Tax=Hygrophoropsis aurantiaca TaxID=72124 RepID=A0ACB8APG5_9AGAM|nr:dipeptidase [Hygrophoropsis aurantiaca]